MLFRYQRGLPASADMIMGMPFLPVGLRCSPAGRHQFIYMTARVAAWIKQVNMMSIPIVRHTALGDAQ